MKIFIEIDIETRRFFYILQIIFKWMLCWMNVNESYMEIGGNHTDKIYFASIIRKLINNRLWILNFIICFKNREITVNLRLILSIVPSSFT